MLVLDIILFQNEPYIFLCFQIIKKQVKELLNSN
jgi:hypothetical protein